MIKTDIQEIEVDLLVQAIRLRYGYDFSNYARASLVRRIRKGLECDRYENVSEIIPEVIHNESFFKKFFLNLSINVTEMFRDPSFYLALRNKVMPFLKTYPFIKIWVAGCSSGQEVYSLAILLEEEGIYNKSLIYATDFNDVILEKADNAIFPIDDIKKYTENYQRSGGTKSFGDYYHSDDMSVIMNQTLKEKIVFSNHNLATDASFGEMNLILCRNVLIYFNKTLRERVLNLFQESLCYNGILCLGNKETIKFSGAQGHFTVFNDKEKIFQKKNG